MTPAPMPAFARHVHTLAWLLANPLPSLDFRPERPPNQRDGGMIGELRKLADRGEIFPLADLMRRYPSVARNTLISALTDAKTRGYVAKLGGGRWGMP